MTFCIHYEFNSPALQVVIYFLVVDHLAEQIDFLVRVFFQCLVTDFDGILNAITKAKVPGHIKHNRPKVENGGRKILLPEISPSACLLDSAGDGRPIVYGYVKLFDGSAFGTIK